LIGAGALSLALAATGVLAQDATMQQKQLGVTTPSGSTVTVTGTVVRYTPGQSIVIKNDANREVTYILSSGVDIPADVSTGRFVTLYTEPGATARETHVTRVSVSSDGSQTVTTQSSGDMSSGETVNVTGTVQAFVPGQSITLQKPDGSTVTYTVTSQSMVPEHLATGKTVTVKTTKTKVKGNTIVERVTYTTKTK
jgi:hypothetical protein